MKQIITILLFIIAFALLVMLFSRPKGEPIPINKTTFTIDYTNYNMCIRHIKKYEGYSFYAYQVLPDTNWYVGYGFRAKDSLTTMSKMKADLVLIEYFNKDIEYCSKEYNIYGTQALGVANLTYRWGRGNLKKSKLHKALKEKNILNVFKHWSSINKFTTINEKGEKIKIEHTRINERMEFELRMYFNK